MFILSTSFALCFLGSLVKAQSANDSALDILAIEAHFTGSGIVPSLLATFDPSAVMTVTFPGVGAISPGQNLTEDQVASTPLITIVPANSSVSLQGNYTLVMADADIVGTNESNGQTRHWLVNGVTLTGSNSSLNASTDAGVAVTAYAGPAPAAGSGAHRYVILLLPQPATFSPPANLSTANVGVSVFELTDYISTSNLGAPVAGMYFEVEEGIATVSVSPTSPVISSTLKPVTPTGTSTSSSANPAKASSSSNGANAIGSGHSSVFAIPVAFGVLFASYMCL
jgi:phosphatidylethanolamine-binding protein (PEBP) family uncharacterized protein